MSKLYDLFRIEKGGKAIIVHALLEQDEANATLQYYELGKDGCKYQIRPSKPKEAEDWRKRELEKFTENHYVPVLWHEESWVSKEYADHFVHVAQGDPSQIAFTENEEKGKANKQMCMAPSKYLARFYGKIISEDTIREWCAKHKKQYGATYELKFAYTADEIYQVYRDGPESCMQGVESVRAYEGPDLAVAYIESKGRIVSRTVCYPARKLYCISYGDRHLMKEALEEHGYEYSSRFQGAKFKAIWANDRRYPHAYPMMPSIECASEGVIYEEEFVTIR